MQLLYALAIGIALVALSSMVLSTLTYALRDFSRPRLQEKLELRGKLAAYEKLTEHVNDFIFATASLRLLSNIVILVFVLRAFHETGYPLNVQYLFAMLVAMTVSLLASVALPNAFARYAGESIIAVCVGLLHFLRFIMLPVIKVMQIVDDVVRRAAGATTEPEPERIEQEILSVVEEGEKDGVVDAVERKMIESVIHFHETVVGQVMTARPEIMGIETGASLDEVKEVLEASGHSRVPVYEGTLDHIVGVLYARDLLKLLGQPADKFDMRAAVRPAFFVPESKPLRDLLKDFRQQKVHMAIVLDEYGGTAGLISIEDLMEELVGEISDEHEPATAKSLKKINDHTWEADARVYLDQLNRDLKLNIPEDEGYDTLGGFLSTALGRIPPTGTMFEHDGAQFTVLDAEPQKVNRVQITLTPVAVDAPTGK